MARFAASAFVGIMVSLLCVALLAGLAVYRLGWPGDGAAAACTRVAAATASPHRALSGGTGARRGPGPAMNRRLEVRAPCSVGLLQLLRQAPEKAQDDTGRFRTSWRCVAGSDLTDGPVEQDAFLYSLQAAVAAGRYLVVLWTAEEIDEGRAEGSILDRGSGVAPELRFDPLESRWHRWIEVTEGSRDPLRLTFH